MFSVMQEKDTSGTSGIPGKSAKPVLQQPTIEQTRPVPRRPQQLLPPESLNLILPPPCIGVRLDQQETKKQPEQSVGVRLTKGCPPSPLAKVFKTPSIPKDAVPGHSTILKQPSSTVKPPKSFKKHWGPKRKRKLTELPIVLG